MDMGDASDGNEYGDGNINGVNIEGKGKARSFTVVSIDLSRKEIEAIIGISTINDVPKINMFSSWTYEGSIN